MELDDIRKQLSHLNLIDCIDRERWLPERRYSIGASETADLYGVGYMSPYDLWTRKVFPESFTDDGDERFEIKLDAEPIIIDAYARKFGTRATRWPSYTIARHRELPLHVTPDGFIEEPDREGLGSFSIKAWSEMRRSDWVGTMPEYIQVQAQTELAVTGLQWGVVAVMFGTQYVERFFFERDDEFILDIAEAAREFWRLVTERIEPPMDELKSTSEALARIWPKDRGKAIMLPEDVDLILLEREKAKETIATAEKVLTRAENELKLLLKDASYGVSPGQRVVSWKQQARKAKFCSCGAQIAAGCEFRVLRSHAKLPLGVALDGPPGVRSITDERERDSEDPGTQLDQVVVDP